MASHWLCNEGKNKSKISGAKAAQGLTAAGADATAALAGAATAHAGEVAKSATPPQAPVAGAAKSADKPAKPSKAAVGRAHTAAGGNATAGPAGAATKQSRVATRPKISVFAPDAESADKRAEPVKAVFSRGSKKSPGEDNIITQKGLQTSKDRSP